MILACARPAIIVRTVKHPSHHLLSSTLLPIQGVLLNVGLSWEIYMVRERERKKGNV